MSKAEELAQQLDYAALDFGCDFAAAAAELRRLAALEQAAEPVAVFKEGKSFGHVEFIPFQGPPLKEGDKLYTHPPRKPMTREQASNLMRELNEQQCEGSRCWGWIDVIRAVERLHGIKE